MLQYSTTHRNNVSSDLITQIGATGYILFYTGSPPANCAASATGTLLASLPLNATSGVASGGVLTLNGTATATAASSLNPITAAISASGTAGYFRICTSSAGTTCVSQGLVYATSTASTSAASTAVPTLTFSAAPSVVNGQMVTGTGIPAGTYIISGGGTTTLSLNNDVTVSSGESVTFGGDISLASASFQAGVTLNITSAVLTSFGA